MCMNQKQEDNQQKIKDYYKIKTDPKAKHSKILINNNILPNKIIPSIKIHTKPKSIHSIKNLKIKTKNISSNTKLTNLNPKSTTCSINGTIKHRKIQGDHYKI